MWGGIGVSGDAATILPPPSQPRGGLEARGKKVVGRVKSSGNSKEALIASARERFEETMLLRERVSVAEGGQVEAPPDPGDDGWVPPVGYKEYNL